MTVLFAALATGQSAPNFWKQVGFNEITLSEKSEILSLPSDYKLFSLDYPSMVAHLRHAPQEGTAAASSSAFRVMLPLANGVLEEFRVWESSVMHPDLAAKYPEIRTFAGQGVTDPTKTLRLGHGYDGFHAVVLGPEKGTAITWLATGQYEYYMAFEPSKFDALQGGTPPLHTCGHDHVEHIDPALTPAAPPVQFRGGGEGALTTKRRYRLALSCTSAYANIHGGTLQGVLSSFVTATNTLNTVLHRDVDVELFLSPLTENLIFLTADSDPFTNINIGGALLSQNVNITNSTIGLGAYDIAQVFTGPCQDVGGVVSGSACSLNKAAGVTCNWGSNIVAWCGYS